jgi:transcription initiation factor TFIIIB Brf1 subunit/transcription initiation factor TFIIB
MERKYEVIKHYHITLVCDKCGTEMKNSEFDSDLYWQARSSGREMKDCYKNICPSCGEVVYTGVSYPYTQYKYKRE